MDFSQLVSHRRSCRRFEAGELTPVEVEALLRAALLSPTSRNNRSWQFVVVEEKTDLEKLADVKESGSAFVAGAAVAVVVAGCPDRNDCWVEDGSIAAYALQLQAADMGLASCWVQVRGRRLSDGTTSADVVRGILGIPDDIDILCIIAFGKPAAIPSPHSEDTLSWENIHPDKY